MIKVIFAIVFGAWLVAAPTGQARAGDGSAQPGMMAGGVLDRVANAVEGAESSHGRDPLMWRSNLLGPQGPMQVSAAAAFAAGGGNRFDPQENRQIGRAYLAGLYRRFGTWTAASAAYYWGPGNLEQWLAAGHSSAELPSSVHVYVSRVAHELADTNAARAPVAATAVPPATLAPPPAIKDPALHKAFEDNLAATRHLRAYLDGTASDATAVLATISSISGRRGYEEFKTLPGAKRHTPSPTGLREIASVLFDKLQSENAGIVLADERRRGELR